MIKSFSFLLLFFLVWSSSAFADSLIIKFKSGKTQEVILEDRMDAIEGMYFKSGNEKAKPSSPSSQKISDPVKSKKRDEGSKKEAKEEEGRPKIRIKWVEPKIGE